METLLEEAELRQLKFYEWPAWIKQRMTEYYHERRRMTRKTRQLQALGELPVSKQLTDFQVIDDHVPKGSKVNELI